MLDTQLGLCHILPSKKEAPIYQWYRWVAAKTLMNSIIPLCKRGKQSECPNFLRSYHSGKYN